MSKPNRLGEVLVTGTVFGNPTGAPSATPHRCHESDPRGGPPFCLGDVPHHPPHSQHSQHDANPPGDDR